MNMKGTTGLSLLSAVNTKTDDNLHPNCVSFCIFKYLLALLPITFILNLLWRGGGGKKKENLRDFLVCSQLWDLEQISNKLL